MVRPSRVCVVTGSRAEFGLLRWTMAAIEESPMLELQVIATGSHLSERHGMTIDEVERSGFAVDARVALPLDDNSPAGVARATGVATSLLADAFAVLSPDAVLVLGDRFEIFAAATAAYLSRIPVIHVHGGEVTAGAVDDALRHSITKMASLHFVALPEYRRRVLQLGESPETVHVVGALGWESVRREHYLSRAEVEQRLGLDLREPTVLVTFHPETMSPDGGLGTCAAMVEALLDRPDLGLVVSLPNADAGAGAIEELLMTCCARHPRAVAHRSMGQQLYLSTMALVGGVVGNSSSGLFEAPALGVPTLDIGVRQQGRARPASVITCEGTFGAVREGIEQLLRRSATSLGEATSQLEARLNPSAAIVTVLEEVLPLATVAKLFVDLPVAAAE